MSREGLDAATRGRERELAEAELGRLLADLPVGRW